MKSTGEVMGVANDFPAAFGKAQAAAGAELPDSGTVFISVTDGDKRRRPSSRRLPRHGLHGGGHGRHGHGDPADGRAGRADPKLSEGSPNVVERIEAGEVDLVINTLTGSGARADGCEIRRAAVRRGIPCITTMSGASAAQRAVRRPRGRDLGAAPSRSCTAGCARIFGASRRRRGAHCLSEPRTLAPPERRVATVSGWSGSAVHRAGSLRASDPQPGQIHARRRERVGEEAATSVPPAARVLVRACLRGVGRARAQSFLLEAVGPGNGAARRAVAGRGRRWLARSESAFARRRRAHARCSWAAASGRPLCCAGRRSWA